MYCESIGNSALKNPTCLEVKETYKQIVGLVQALIVNPQAFGKKILFFQEKKSKLIEKIDKLHNTAKQKPNDLILKNKIDRLQKQKKDLDENIYMRLTLLGEAGQH